MFIPSQATSNAETATLSIGVPIEPAKRIRNCQIICGAMIAGVLTFAVVTQFISSNPSAILLSYIGLAFALVQIVLRFVIPGIVTRTQMQKLTGAEVESLDSQLFAIFQTKLIVGLAFLEGAALFNLVCYLTERKWWSLAVVGFLIVMMASMFPTLRQFENWAEDRKRDLQNQF